MKNIIKELTKEILNKKMTLLEMDNTIIKITESETSIYKDLYYCLEQKSCSYYINENKSIIIEFDIIKNNEDELLIEIKVNNIWED